VAQTWRVSRNAYTRRASERQPRPLDEAQLQALALHYVGRYATTRAKLAAYLGRKLRERGWAGKSPADPLRIVQRFTELGYIDDRGFATMRGASLSRRGYGARRIEADLRAAGIEEADREDAGNAARDQDRDAALTLARRRRLGPFAADPADRATREKTVATLLRAGHNYEIAREIADLRSEDVKE